MKRLLTVSGLVVLLLLAASTAALAKPATTSIDLLNPPKKGLLVLSVGESYTFDIEVTSVEPFILAMAMSDEYYPGRGVFFAGNDIVNHATSAVLHLTITGKEPTDFLPDGVAPVAVVAGMRFPGGVTLAERFDMNVLVVP